MQELATTFKLQDQDLKYTFRFTNHEPRLCFSQWDHLTQTTPNMSHFLFDTKFALFGYAYKRLPWRDYRYFFGVELGSDCTRLNHSEKSNFGEYIPRVRQGSPKF